MALLFFFGLIFYSSQLLGQDTVNESDDRGFTMSPEKTFSELLDVRASRSPAKSLKENTRTIITKERILVINGGEQVIVEKFLNELEFPVVSRNGVFWGVLKKEKPEEILSKLSLFNQVGQKLWEQNDVPNAKVVISDDGKIVVAVHGYSIIDPYYSINFYNAEGTLINFHRDIQFDPSRGVQLSPDGNLFLVSVSGEDMDGSVSINDRFVGFNRLGQKVWEATTPNLHFTGELEVTDTHVIASCYSDAGRNQYILIYDHSGSLIHQIKPKIDNYGKYKLSTSSEGKYLVAFGFKHIVLVETQSGQTIWEWETKIKDQKWLIADCSVNESGEFVTAFAYSGQQGREMLLFNEEGELIKNKTWKVEVSSWGDLKVISSNMDTYMFDTSNGYLYHFTF